jgi:hypothetical protein
MSIPPLQGSQHLLRGETTPVTQHVPIRADVVVSLKRPNASFFAFPTLRNFHWAICPPFLDRCDKCLTFYFWPPWSALKRMPQADPLSASPLKDASIRSRQAIDSGTDNVVSGMTVLS